MTLAEELQDATKERQKGLLAEVQGLRVRQKRQLFMVMRTHPAIDADLFLPGYGMHCGEFACCHLLSERSRRDIRRSATLETSPSPG